MVNPPARAPRYCVHRERLRHRPTLFGERSPSRRCVALYAFSHILSVTLYIPLSGAVLLSSRLHGSNIFQLFCAILLYILMGLLLTWYYLGWKLLKISNCRWKLQRQQCVIPAGTRAKVPSLYLVPGTWFQRRE